MWRYVALYLSVLHFTIGAPYFKVKLLFYCYPKLFLIMDYSYFSSKDITSLINVEKCSCHKELETYSYNVIMISFVNLLENGS